MNQETPPDELRVTATLRGASREQFRLRRAAAPQRSAASILEEVVDSALATSPSKPLAESTTVALDSLSIQRLNDSLALLQQQEREHTRAQLVEIATALSTSIDELRKEVRTIPDKTRGLIMTRLSKRRRIAGITATTLITLTAFLTGSHVSSHKLSLVENRLAEVEKTVRQVGRQNDVVSQKMVELIQANLAARKAPRVEPPASGQPKQ
jgi:hypothetical protein